MHCQLLILHMFLFLGVVYSEPAADIGETLKNLNVDGLPSNLGNITETFKVEDAEKILAEKCRKNSGSDQAYDNAKKAAENAQECVKNIVDFEVLQEEMDKAKPTGDLDLVFKKYCRQSPALKKCVFDLTNAYEPCLESTEIETKNTAINVTDSLVDFICHKDGDRIALFIAEGGPDCLNASSAGIKKCVETVFAQKIEGDTPTLDSLPLLLLKTEECEKFTQMQLCVVKEMERCPETTPANVIDSLFNFIRRHTPCSKIAPKSASTGGQPTNGSNSLTGSVVFTVITWISLQLTHF